MRTEQPARLLTIAFFGFLCVSQVRAEPNQESSLEAELGVLAKQITEYLQQKSQDSVAVGQFTSPPRLRASAGPGIAHCLGRQLEKLGIKVKTDASLVVAGNYFTDVADAGDGQNMQAILLKARIEDEQGRVLANLRGRKIFGTKTLATMLALNVEMKPGEDAQETDRKIRASLQKPDNYVSENTQITAGPHCPYAVEILIRKADGNYETRAPATKDGLAFVPIKKEEIYAVRLINNSPLDAAVILSIDGLSMFAFSEERDQYKNVLISAKSAGVIEGWHINDKKSDSFLVSHYSQSAAAQSLFSEAGIGTIHAVFAAAWEEGRVPDDEPAGRGGDLGTGRGPRIDKEYSVEKRVIGKTRASISVRYTK